MSRKRINDPVRKQLHEAWGGKAANSKFLPATDLGVRKKGTHDAHHRVFDDPKPKLEEPVDSALRNMRERCRCEWVGGHLTNTGKCKVH